jgi:DUF971 family protein
MNNQKPKKIYRPKPYLISVEFEDGAKFTIKLQSLRDNCPCAECVGEEFPSIDGKKRITVPGLNTMKPGKYELKELNVVGNYGIQPVWGDGHDAGLYLWEQIREIFEKNNLTDEEIQKLEEKYNKN